MTGALTLYRSSIGKKAIMAVSGLIGIGFLVLHMYGNLKIFEGPEYFNTYAAGLRSLGAPVFGHMHLLWIGIDDRADQLNAMKFFRKELAIPLRALGSALRASGDEAGALSSYEKALAVASSTGQKSEIAATEALIDRE